MESREAPVSRYRRWNELLELLATDGQLQVDRAAEVLGVSAATVRRDFDELARQQMLTRIRGGALAQGVTYDLPYGTRANAIPPRSSASPRWPRAWCCPARSSA